LGEKEGEEKNQKKGGRRGGGGASYLFPIPLFYPYDKEGRGGEELKGGREGRRKYRDTAKPYRIF